MAATRGRLAKSEYEALAEFRYSLRRFLRSSEAVAGEAGLTPQQHQALLAIKGFPGRDRVTVSELAERLQLRHHSAVGLADRLALARFVKREPDAEDRRRVYLALTARGEAVLERLSSAHKDLLRRMQPQLAALLECLQR